MGGVRKPDVTGILCVLSGSGGGTGPVLDTQTVTVASLTSGSDPTLQYRGYNASGPAFGSISDGTSNIYGGAAITALYFYQEGFTSPPVGFTTRQLVLTITGATNSGWTTMKVGTTNFARTDAFFSSGSWVWDIPIPNPFADEGDPFTATTIVEWT